MTPNKNEQMIETWNLARRMCGCPRCIPVGFGLDAQRECQVDDAFSALMDEHNLQAAPSQTPFTDAIKRDMLQTEFERAKKTLLRAGFEDCGDEYWKPPAGKNPLPELDAFRREHAQATARIKELEARLDEIAELARGHL